MTNNTDGNKQAGTKSSANAKKQQPKQESESVVQAQEAGSNQTNSNDSAAIDSKKQSGDLEKQPSSSDQQEGSTEQKETVAASTNDSRNTTTATEHSVSEQASVARAAMDSSEQKSFDTPPAAAPKPTASVAKRGWTGPLALVISLAALAGVGGIAYLDYDVRYFLSNTQPFDPVKVSQTEAAKVESKLVASVKATSQQVSSQADSLASQLAQQQRQLKGTEQKLKQDVLGVAENISNLRRQFNQMQGTSRDDWQLAEVEYMLRLANQRLLTEGDTRGVEAILVSADAILRGLDNYSLYAVREALANDLAAIRAVEQTDIEGTYLQLSALVNQVMALPLMPVADYQKTQSASGQEEAPDADLSDKLSAKLKRTWSNFSDHLRINISRDKSVQILLTPKEEMFLRQNLRMMLEQAQLSLLQGNQVIYSNSLHKTTEWLKEYFVYDSTKVAAINKQLTLLADVKLNPKLPDISGSLKATKQYIDELHRLHKGKLPTKEEVANAPQQGMSSTLAEETH